ncbi:M4 family peptidase [Mycolicibacterium sp. 018/SC-01/001]|uniref:M4 family metallopeptidase n=1 Tax=Mycolicibacterium sp. 018/SC-01/001 TaxID=2592069 RepID=UPI00117DD81D|nr:M4 family metallopeptidase [Mycolicibacterium sp. 018/SC-01/001]TRW88298.1 M4 family peptidase [Mycolicibacterium sp. 018/SC-01/001]
MSSRCRPPAVVWTGVAVLGFGVGLVIAPGIASAAPSDTATESTARSAKTSSVESSVTPARKRAERVARVEARRDAIRQRRHTFRDVRPTAAPETDDPAADGTVRGSLNATDRDDTDLSYTVSSGAAWGSVTVDADGGFVYTPADGKAGRADSFTITVDDRPRWRPTEVTIAVPAGKAADDDVRTIDGRFTDRVVTGVQDAAAVMNDAAHTLGIAEGFADPAAITVSTAGSGDDAETHYRLVETIDGVPVLGSDVILVTDASGAVTGLFDHYRGLSESFDVTPDAAKPRLRRMADQQLVVYAPDNRTVPILAWQVVGAVPGVRFSRPGSAVLIGAGGTSVGDVIVARPTASAVSATDIARDWVGARRTFIVDKRTTKWSTVYRLIDRDRDITTYKTSFPYFGLLGGFLPGTVVKRGLLGWNTDAVSAHANAEDVYDFYEEVLGRTSFDGNGAPVLVSIRYSPGRPTGGYANAFWDPSIAQFAFGDSGHLEAAIDVVGHEFTHAVVTYVVGGPEGGSLVLDSGESGALNEALADIMGTLIENDSGPDRWLVGEDSGLGAIRNLADPASISTSLGPHRATYATRYQGTLDDGGEHVNSTIFSHAAYLMMTDPATAGVSSDTWADVFYRAMFRLSAGSDFSDGRAAVQSAAQAVGLTSAQQAAVVRAFDAVGIPSAATLTVV